MEQEAADAEHKAFVKEIKAMKKPALMKELKQRGLEFKGSQDVMRDRLLEAVKAEKEAADEERREASMTEEEKLAREMEEQAAEEERLRIEAEEALAEDTLAAALRRWESEWQVHTKRVPVSAAQPP